MFLRTNGQATEFWGAGIDVLDLFISEEGIFSALLHLDTRKATGPDDILNAFIYRYAEWSAKYLHIVLTKAYKKQVPEDWEIALSIKWVISSLFLTTEQYPCCALQVK